MDQPVANMRNVQVLGIDAGGTMTDIFFVDADGDFVVGKAQSTPEDESVGLIASSEDGLANWGISMSDTLSQLQTGVYSGTAMINRVVQRKGLKCGLILNRGMEDNHRMGRAVGAVHGSKTVALGRQRCRKCCGMPAWMRQTAAT